MNVLTEIQRPATGGSTLGIEFPHSPALTSKQFGGFRLLLFISFKV